MSYTAKELLKLASDYDNVATRALVVTAAKKEKKKLDPKAKVRNRGTVCVPAESAKDKKDHFPINNEAQARNALARVNQFSKVPEWYSGSLQGLVSLVARKVHSKYPGITVSKDAKKPGKKKASEYYDNLLAKFAVGTVRPEDAESSKVLTQSTIQSINAVNTSQLTPDKVVEYVDGFMAQTQNYFNGNQIDGQQFSAISQAANAKKQQVANPTPQGATTTTPAAGQTTPTKPTVPARQSLPVRQDVIDAQNQLYKANEDFAQRLEQVGGVDGKLGRVTVQLLREYLPRMTTEDAVKYLSEEEKKSQAPKPEAEQPTVPPNPYNENRTWGV